ncbi:MAG: molecular chaperone DnaJ [Bradymonadia bacterium]|jgi:molecular chaperone DnaJ
MAADDFYTRLGVARDADAAALKAAYRRLAMQYHPDRNPGDADAESTFKDVSEAYGVLSDPQKRQMYDRFGSAGLSGGAGFGNVDDIFSHFSDIFGDILGFGRARAKARTPRGNHVRADISITLEECLTGVARALSIPRHSPCEPCGGDGAKPGTAPAECPTCKGRGQVAIGRGIIAMKTTCPRCRGTGRVIPEPCDACDGTGQNTVTERLTVKVPAGIDHGRKLKVPGKGEPGPQGAQPGDLYLVVHLAEHARFERHRADLLGEVSVGMAGAALGVRVVVDGLDGPIEVEIAPGTQPGDLVRLSGRGLPHIDGTPGRGDMQLRVDVQVPRRLNPAQVEALNAFIAAGTATSAVTREDLTTLKD